MWVENTMDRMDTRLDIAEEKINGLESQQEKKQN